MSDTKKDIMWRVWLLYSGTCLFALLIIVQVIRIKFVEGQMWIAKADSLELRMVTITPSRGNIFASDGSLLATSTPIYELRIDTKADVFKNAVLNSKLDSLAQGLSKILADRSASEYKKVIRQAKADGERYFLLKKGVSYKQYKDIQQLPLFNRGRFKSGLRVIADSERRRPFDVLAARTIGYSMLNVKPVGLEGAFNEQLSGVVGKRIEQRMAGGVYKPINDENEIEPQDGMDIISTIDINIQDVAEHALQKQLEKYNARYGCAVLMEVHSGDVKAIANLTRNNDGKYYESFNYAIGMGSEPGSTFKLASLIAALDHNLVDITDTVDVGNGVAMYAGLEMKDSHRGSGKVTLQHAFEVSSNVGVSKVITEAYSKNPKRFTDKLSEMYLDKPLQLQIHGEAKPRIPTPADVKVKFGWSKATLPFMSIGYETKLAPIQTLTFYNAVANNGKMVKPRFVKEIRQKGALVKSFETEVLVDSICSASTVSKAKLMMEGVVQRGTATNLKFEAIKIAGKTGTARMAYGGKGYVSNDSIRYQASFCGYFPADNPLYSCIVVIYELDPTCYTGNLVAGPVFKEIADKVYATRIDMHPEINAIAGQLQLPKLKTGDSKATKLVLNALQLNHTLPQALWQPLQQNLNTDIIPDVTGMGLRDAVKALENCGLYVRAIGKGAVTKQSITAGSPAVKGKLILIELT